ncbi:MAG: hypothetical protein IT523_08480, partial [Burkholderiales bacterium]|nr:hypothetical protein [Burkholderiales bacterium]
YRELPDGSAMTIPYVIGTSTAARQLGELWKKSMDAIGVRLAIDTMKTPDLRKAARNGQGRMTREGWNADYPDAENFFQMLISATAARAARTTRASSCRRSMSATSASTPCPTAPSGGASSARWRIS